MRKIPISWHFANTSKTCCQRTAIFCRVDLGKSADGHVFEKLFRVEEIEWAVVGIEGKFTDSESAKEGKVCCYQAGFGGQRSCKIVR